VNEVRIFTTDFQIFSKIKFLETPFTGNRVVPCGQTDIHVETCSLFRNFADLNLSLVHRLVACISPKTAADAAALVTDPSASRALSSLQCVLLANVGILIFYRLLLTIKYQDSVWRTDISNSYLAPPSNHCKLIGRCIKHFIAKPKDPT
jgi:hypothetical protein